MPLQIEAIALPVYTPMNHQDNIPADDPRTRAAQWFARVQSGQATHEEIDVCAAWRRADPAHDAAYRKVEFLWLASRQLPQQELCAMLAASRAATGGAASPARRRFGWAVAAACAAIAAVAVALLLLNSEASTYRAAFETQPGERREETLPDGSVLSLNMNTRLEVAFFETSRFSTRPSASSWSAPTPSRVRASTCARMIPGWRWSPDRCRCAGAWWNKTARQLTAG